MILVTVILISTLVGVAIGTGVEPDNLKDTSTLIVVIVMFIILIPYCYYVYN